MATSKQAEANRRNAARSTGPRTKEGKERTSLNALKHGLTAESPMLPTEDAAVYEEFSRELMGDLAPQGAIEKRLAREIVDLSWRLKRASHVEKGVFVGGVASVDQRHLRDLQRRQEVTEGDLLAAKMGPSLEQVVELVNADAHDLLGERIADIEEVQRSEEVRLATAFVEDAAGPDALSRLSRYEASLFRRRSQALETLQKLQAQHEVSPQDSE